VRPRSTSAGLGQITVRPPHDVSVEELAGALIRAYPRDPDESNGRRDGATPSTTCTQTPGSHRDTCAAVGLVRAGVAGPTEPAWCARARDRGRSSAAAHRARRAAVLDGPCQADRPVGRVGIRASRCAPRCRPRQQPSLRALRAPDPNPAGRAAAEFGVGRTVRHRVNGSECRASAGGVLTVPAGAAHGFAADAPEGVRLSGIHAPARIAQTFVDDHEPLSTAYAGGMK
jgi:hypothetical protein